MDFGRVLTRSWEIIWKHKALWIFGILASCGGQFGGLSGSGTNYSFDVSDTRNLPGQFDRFFADWERGINQFVNNVGPSFFVALACVAVILAIFFWVVGIYGKVGLISGVLNAEARRAVGFRVVAAEAWPVLGSALGLNFILALLPIAAVILLIILAIPVGILTLGIGLLCLIPLVCLLIPIGIAYGVYIEMANISLVRDRQGVGLALSRAWQVFRDHLGPLAGMAIILILGGHYTYAQVPLGLWVEELFALSDRLIVLRGGRIVASFRPDETDVFQVGHFMTGSEVQHVDAT